MIELVRERGVGTPRSLTSSSKKGRSGRGERHGGEGEEEVVGAGVDERQLAHRVGGVVAQDAARRAGRTGLGLREVVHREVGGDVGTVAGGARNDRPMLRVAYEAGLGPWVFVSASFETDFDSILQSAVIDVATPQVLIFLPSLRAGTGVVARQLGPRDADVGVRLRLGASMFAAGGDVDFDYWPAIDEWTMTGALRISL